MSRMENNEKIQIYMISVVRCDLLCSQALTNHISVITSFWKTKTWLSLKRVRCTVGDVISVLTNTWTVCLFSGNDLSQHLISFFIRSLTLAAKMNIDDGAAELSCVQREQLSAGAPSHFLHFKHLKCRLMERQTVQQVEIIYSDLKTWLRPVSMYTTFCHDVTHNEQVMSLISIIMVVTF